jgi:ligand-binding sensor domain-containing protein
VNATVYGEKEGFASINRVTNITEDNYGLIWISGENGLQSFNGTQFKSYRHSTKDPNSLPSNFVQFIFQDKRNTYWTYIRHKGLYNYDPQREVFTKYRYHNEHNFNLHQSYQFEVGQPFEDRHGRLWVPLLGYGLAEIDRLKNIVIPYKICIPGNCGTFYNASYVTKILEDKRGEFWLATNGGLVNFNPTTGKYMEIIESDLQKRAIRNERLTVFSYFGPQIGDNIWIGTWGSGIKKLNTVTKRFETFLWHAKTWDGTKNICTGIWQKDSTHLWVSSLDNELFVFDLKTFQFQSARQLSDENFVLSGDLTVQATDGSLWIKHTNGTLIKISKKELFSSYVFGNKHAINPKNFSASCFLQIEKALYIGAAFDSCIYKYDLATQSYHSFRIPGATYRSETNFLLAAPEQRGFYVGGYNGLAFFNSYKQNFESLNEDSISKGLLHQELLCAIRGADNSIWIGCRNSDRLLRYFPLTGETKEYRVTAERSVTEMPSFEYFIKSIALGQHNDIWFSHSHYGLGNLNIRDGKTVFFNSFRKKTFPLAFSNDVLVADDGSIFFTTLGEGVWRLKDPFSEKEEIVNYDRANGLPSDMVRFLHQDRNKNIWFFSSNGLTLFDPLSATSKNFYNVDGLKSSFISNRPYENSDGVVYIGFNNGFQTFQPESLANQKVRSYRLIVHDFKVNNASWPVNVNYANKIMLKPDQNYLQFDFAAITHDNPQQLSYSYMLEGFDKNWIQAGNSTVGNYNKLPAGHYTLKIKLNDGKPTDRTNYFELPIVISAHWYRTSWFKTLVVIALLAIIYVAHRYRVSVLHNEAKLRSEFAQRMTEAEMRALRAQMNPHFIFNCLSSINRYIVKSDHKTASGYLTKFSKLIRLILDNSAADTVSLEKELQSLQLYIDMEALRFDHAFTWTIQVDERIDKEDSFIPPMLLQPYVENAIWHGLLHKETGTGKLTIKLSQLSDTILITQIEDNGIGRQQAKEMNSKETGNRKSYGMQISRDRLALLNQTTKESATVAIEDLVNGNGLALGTRVTIRIPLQKPVDKLS